MSPNDYEMNTEYDKTGYISAKVYEDLVSVSWVDGHKLKTYTPYLILRELYVVREAAKILAPPPWAAPRYQKNIFLCGLKKWEKNIQTTKYFFL